ncbi:glycosyltransferase [Flavobacterium sp. 2]|uniref:glycosyltransferase n=1 Tax=Flavobacterium sp. 2 TaxID=308053 RepID=UPI000C198AB2|nr:glycosyltransferase [Flavobacterium sp. 2]PIF59334.1 glycosyltransferase involved in cell wall biosynthesis [Flavobacterium sp. 2]
MKKAIFVITSLDSGGIENYLLRFLRHLENEIEPIVICRGNHFGELEKEYLKIKHIKLVKIDLTKFRIKSYYELYLYLKKNKEFSFVDFTGAYSGILLLLANLAGLKKRILFFRGSSHDFEPTFLKLIFVNFLKYLGKINATQVLSNSKAALNFYFPKRNVNDSKFKVIYNGIDAEMMNFEKYNKETFNIPVNSFVIGHTGRYDKAKNHATIIKIAEKICTKYENVYFVLCGKNTEVFLKKQIDENKVLREKVKLLGYRNDVSNILTMLDLYLFPSITEGQPNSLIEAMVAKLPIVASNIDPILETTPSFFHQELIAPLDVDSFVNRIEEYYLDDSKRENADLSEWAINQFSADKLFKEFCLEL